MVSSQVHLSSIKPQPSCSPSMQTHRVVQPLTQSTSPFLSHWSNWPTTQRTRPSSVQNKRLLGHQLYPVDFQKHGRLNLHYQTVLSSTMVRFQVHHWSISPQRNTSFGPTTVVVLLQHRSTSPSTNLLQTLSMFQAIWS